MGASGLATHDHALANCSEWWPKMQAVYREFANANQLECILWQCPPSLHCTIKSLHNLNILCQALAEDPSMRHVFEFRHKSWYESGDLLRILEKHRCCLAWLNLHEESARTFVD